MNDLKELFAVDAEACRLERERCIAAVDAEPELPGDMPDEMWNAVRNDRDAMCEAFRMTVRLIKDGIKGRINEAV